MMARTRFMPPPQIGFAGQTYRTFGARNRCMGQIRQECWESDLDWKLQAGGGSTIRLFILSQIKQTLDHDERILPLTALLW